MRRPEERVILRSQASLGDSTWHGIHRIFAADVDKRVLRNGTCVGILTAIGHIYRAEMTYRRWMRVVHRHRELR